MKTPDIIPRTHRAILTLAEIKTAVAAFDRGEINVIDALDAIVVAVGSYQAAAQSRREAA